MKSACWAEASAPAPVSRARITPMGTASSASPSSAPARNWETVPVSSARRRLETGLKATVTPEPGCPDSATQPRASWEPARKDMEQNSRVVCHRSFSFPRPNTSLGLQAGSSHPGLRHAIARIADWLTQNRRDDSWGVNWPNAVSIVKTDTSANAYVQASNSESSPDGPSRCAWCYGSPGVARSLWLAGEALDRSDYRDLAISAMEDVFRRPIATRRIDSPTFCHGVAGLLAITLRFANDTGSPDFRRR